MKIRLPALRTLAQVVGALLLVNLVLGPHFVPMAAAQSPAPIRIVAFGDSLTAGYMLPPSDSFPAQLARRLQGHNPPVEVANAGVSGDTTAAALERFAWAIPDGTDAVIVELGANDALRGLSPATARANLEKLLSQLKGRGIEVLLAGMRAPRNWGAEYAAAFDAIYPELAAKHDVLLYPFFLEGIALDQSLNLPDGLHPNATGVARIVDGILPSVNKLIERAAARRAAVVKG